MEIMYGTRVYIQSLEFSTDTKSYISLVIVHLQFKP